MFPKLIAAVFERLMNPLNPLCIFNGQGYPEVDIVCHRKLLPVCVELIAGTS